MRRHGLFSVLCIAFSVRPSACTNNTLTTIGTEFLIASPNADMNIYIFNKHSSAVEAEIESPCLFGDSDKYWISNVISIAPLNYAVFAFEHRCSMSNESALSARKFGIHLTTTKNVAVVAETKLKTGSETFRVYPTSVLGTEYFAVTTSDDSYEYNTNFILIVANKNNTLVTVSLRNKTLHAVSLDYLDAWIISAKYDLTGAKIASTEPIAVISGSKFFCDWDNNSGSSWCSPVATMLLPTEHWGSTFLMVPFRDSNETKTVVTLVASEAETSITYNYDTTKLDTEGAFKNVTIKGSTPILFQSDKPIQIIQVMKYEPLLLKNGRSGPSFLHLLPANCYSTHALVAWMDSGPQFVHFLTIVTNRQNTDKITVNNRTMTNWTEVGYKTDIIFTRHQIATSAFASVVGKDNETIFTTYAYSMAGAYGFYSYAYLASFAECTIETTTNHSQAVHESNALKLELVTGLVGSGAGVIFVSLAILCIVLRKSKSKSIGNQRSCPIPQQEPDYIPYLFPNERSEPDNIRMAMFDNVSYLMRADMDADVEFEFANDDEYYEVLD